MPYNAANAVSFARGKSGRYGNGECWTLVEDAVVGAGGKSSRTLTPRFGPNSDYVWGTTLPLASVVPGDVLQFRNYTWLCVTANRVTETNGDWTTNSNRATQTRSHHTALVISAPRDGFVEVIEQNIPERSGPVQTIQLRISGGSPVTTRTTDPVTGAVTETTVTHTITNPPRAYRPQNA